MPVVIYCVETYHRAGRKLERAQLRQFAAEPQAAAVAEDLATRAAGVALYSVKGEPAADFWDEPEMIKAYGDVPQAA